MIDVVEQVIERHPKVKNEGIPEDSAVKIKDATDSANSSGQSLDQILNAFSEVNAAIATINSACAEQSTGLTEINSALTSMDAITKENVTMVQKVEGLSKDLLDQSRRVNEAISFFQSHHKK